MQESLHNQIPSNKGQTATCRLFPDKLRADSQAETKTRVTLCLVIILLL